MNNAMRLGKHELQELLDDAQEVADFIGEFIPVAVWDEEAPVAPYMLLTKSGNPAQIDVELFERWQKSIMDLRELLTTK